MLDNNIMNKIVSVVMHVCHSDIYLCTLVWF